MIHIIQVSLVVFIFIGVLSGKTNGGLSDQLWGIFKRWIQSNCNCSSYNCCSKWGYCGSTDAYCGEGCQSGPCKYRPTGNHSSFNITPEMFQCVFPDIDTNVLNRRFQGLTKAMLQMTWKPINSVEAAIFLAHISSETDGLKTLSEDCIKQDSK
jgi:chitinase